MNIKLTPIRRKEAAIEFSINKWERMTIYLKKGNIEKYETHYREQCGFCTETWIYPYGLVCSNCIINHEICNLTGELGLFSELLDTNNIEDIVDIISQMLSLFKQMRAEIEQLIKTINIKKSIGVD